MIAHIRKSDGKIQTVPEHLLETGELAMDNAGKIGLSSSGKLIGISHDIGKTKEFDTYIRSKTWMIDPDEDISSDAQGEKGKIDHSTAGAQNIFRRLSPMGKKESFIAEQLFLCVASHHGGLIDCLTPDGMNNFERRLRKDDSLTHITDALNELDSELSRELDKLLTSSVLFDEMYVLLEKIGKSEGYQELQHFMYGMLTKFLYSCLLDADRKSTADFEDPAAAVLRNNQKYIPWDHLIEKLEAHVFRLSSGDDDSIVQRARKTVSEECKMAAEREQGTYLIPVPTGGGKTLSSLRFALYHARKYFLDRIIYVVPYTTIIDQNACDVRAILEGDDESMQDRVVLEHHSNLTPDKETAYQKILSQNWDAPVVFTTAVQFLETLFGSGTRNARRLHQLARSVLIFDEVQTLPVRCVHLFNNAVNFLTKYCGTTSVLCTATQPLLDKVDPGKGLMKLAIQPKIVTDTTKLYSDLKRVTVHDRTKPGGWTDFEIIELAAEELRESGSVLVVVNTKKSALTLYRACSNIFPGIVFHLSTNMCPAHRRRILNRVKWCLKRRKPVICVSTNLIEAGINIDFGSVIRFLAGLDSIAQAAGRGNRHGHRPNANVYIVNSAYEDLSRLDDIRVGKEISERILYEFKADPSQFDDDRIGLKAMERYFFYSFFERKSEMDYQVGRNSPIGRNDTLLSLLSTNVHSVNEYRRGNNDQYPLLNFRQSFAAAARCFQAIDSSGRGIIVPYGKTGRKLIADLAASEDMETQKSLLKAAQQYSVNVRSVDKLLDVRALFEVKPGTGILYASTEFYSEDYGLSIEIAGIMDALFG